MFWGLNLKPNRKYTQTTSKPFHISLASLESDNVADDGPNQIFINHDNQKFLICTLRKGSCEQVMLDLNFGEGDEICFQCIGSGNVSLTGYLIDKFNFMDDVEDEDESELEEEDIQDLRQALNKKANAKKGVNGKKQKINNAEEDEDDDDEDDSDFNAEGLDQVEEGSDGEDDDDEDDDEDDDDDDDDGDDDDDEDEEEEESEDEEVQQPKAKQPKLEKPQKQQNGIAKESAANKKGKKDKKPNKNEQQPQKQQQQQPKAGGERVITGGVKIEDIRVGNGQEAKQGKRAVVYYEGRLKSNNKVFDSLKTGAGFKFGLGRGEVIKGWDVGVVGMKVGGKRRILCPPHMAYGARGSPPTIPPNSTLVFEVELKGVH
ncbi:39 kDa FK506-binding nuclear protein [Anastrepha obliqua]|uniref:39 kDa FK506-binding nuclear protein n=1 Tax=Anastrepha obliqua TaxID=95512 RepID=UPI0024098B2D|nr:39 kDa FK506-binding nuclear protein [Anastrepha obliqua]